MEPAARTEAPRRTKRSLTILLLTGVCIVSGQFLPDRSSKPRVAAAVPAATGGHAPLGYADFRGEWRLDRQASDPLGPVLRAKGKSLVEIIAASRMPVTHRIHGDHERLTVSVKTPFFHCIEELLTDGTPTRIVGPEGHVAEAVTRWSDDRRSLISTSTDLVGDGLATVTLARSLSADGETMYVHLDYVLPDGESIQIRRVFRRAP